MSEEKGLKRTWNSIKYWWAFEGGEEFVLVCGGIVFGCAGGWLMGYSRGLHEANEKGVTPALELSKELFVDLLKEQAKNGGVENE